MRRVKAVVLGAVMALLLSACDFSIYGLPLPGGPDVGENPMIIEVEFADVLDLVPQSTVKVNDISVGKVTDIDLEGYQALVTLAVRRDVELPDNAVAELRQTSLLGEKFVALSAPPEGASANRLADGDRIPIERAGRNPEVEEVLGALSLLLNGGGVAQLKTITSELNNALEGREDSARSVFRQLRVFMRQLDENKTDIVAAIESLNRLAIAAEKQLPAIDAALEELPSALESIDRQRDDLVEMLAALNQLSGVAVDVIQRSKGATITSLKRLNPVLTQLAASGDNFTKAFHVFLTYPFVDDVVGRDPQVARNLHMGDYTNLSVQLEVDLSGDGQLPTLPTNLPTEVDPTVIIGNVLACLQSGSLSSEACQRVLATPSELLKLKEECEKPRYRDKDVCKELNKLPGLPLPTESLPTTAVPTTVPPGPSLPAVPTVPGAGRAAAGERRPGTGPTMGELMETYDPALVSLLVPGMVIR